MQKKICIVTAARSEYGLLSRIATLIKEAQEDFNLQLVVTGAHLLEEQGFTYKDIEKDGLPISEFVDMQLKTDSNINIVMSMGRCLIGFAEVLEKLKPDLMVVLGDRYELLAICSAALIMNIPIAHISGGDVTEGAIDDQVRNAVTMMATLHFPGNEQSAQNIARMRGSDKNVFNVGELGLDNFRTMTLISRENLAKNLKIDINKRWVLMTYHPETKLSLECNLEIVKNIISALNKIDNIEVVITKSNADFGGKQINSFLEQITELNPIKYKLSFMSQVSLVIGNSSSGIIEAPYCMVPVINIGDRQKGRYLCQNVIQTDTDLRSISNAIYNSFNSSVQNIADSGYYGNGYATEKIVNQIKLFVNE
ncbi:MAG: UDP-N-acetylglucosamine 2-epimerase [Rikenellaceae bacterium]